jgi:hypothetical protein
LIKELQIEAEKAAEEDARQEAERLKKEEEKEREKAVYPFDKAHDRWLEVQEEYGKDSNTIYRCERDWSRFFACTKFAKMDIRTIHSTECRRITRQHSGNLSEARPDASGRNRRLRGSKTPQLRFLQRPQAHRDGRILVWQVSSDGGPHTWTLLPFMHIQMRPASFLYAEGACNVAGGVEWQS